jgi:hypothetical protein
MLRLRDLRLALFLYLLVFLIAVGSCIERQLTGH